MLLSGAPAPVITLSIGLLNWQLFSQIFHLYLSVKFQISKLQIWKQTSGKSASHHPAELEEDVSSHGVDPHHEGGEGVEGEVANEDAPRGASQQPVWPK